MATTASTDLTFTVGLMGASDLSLPQSSPGSGEEILTDWNFSVSGYIEAIRSASP